MSGDRHAKLRAERVEARSLPVSPASVDDVRAAGWTVGELWLPAVVLRADALTHNLDRFADWCAGRGLSHAPHGKTTMAPQLWTAQLECGAWGLSAATVAQARIMRRFGVSRVLVANEIVEPGQVRWVAAELADPDAEIYGLVDSVEVLARVERTLAAAAAPRPLRVLVELGVEGRRTGARGVPPAVELAGRIAESRWLTLAGVEGYEGTLPQRRDGASPARARQYLERLVELLVECDRRGLFADLDEIILTAGGSVYVDVVADAVAAMPAPSRPVRTIVRSGCYVTHDHLFYERTSPFRSETDADPLRPALVGYARVLSVPEEGRALLGVGKRDVSFDIDLPIPVSVRRDGHAWPVEEGRAHITELNDHHAFCAHEPGLLRVGDIVELGLSHPCTVFDKWPLLPVVDASGRVIDAIRTLF